MQDPENFEDADIAVAEKKQRTRTILFIGAMALLAMVIALLLATAMRPRVENPNLEGAVRAGNQDFEAYKKQLVIDEPEKMVAPNLMGMLQFTLRTRIHNRGTRTLNGIEIATRVYDLEDKVISEKVAHPVPRIRSASLQPGESMAIRFQIDAPAKYKEADIKDVRLELRGLRFE
jgi:hypothetical protein